MSWAVGYDDNWKRDIGYGVPAICDHPDCEEIIDRGLAHVCCDQEPYGGEHGCGLYFCMKHLHFGGDHYHQCDRCAAGVEPFTPKSDIYGWLYHKLTDPTWKDWRDENASEVKRIAEVLFGEGGPLHRPAVEREQILEQHAAETGPLWEVL